MKKMILVLLSIAAVGCLESFGYPDPESKMAVVRHDEVFRVIYAGPESSGVRVSISDNEGNLVFRERIAADRFIRPYNFSRLPKGDYVVRIEDANGSHSENISYRDKMWVARISRLKDSENRFLVAIPAQPDSEPVVSVFDQDDQLVFTEYGDANRGFAKIYRLKDLEGGFIQVSNGLSGEAKSLRVAR